jgi:hypothetical protein
MTLKSPTAKKPAEQVIKDIRRVTRRHFSAEDKIRIVLDGLRGEDSIAELCRKERHGGFNRSTQHDRCHDALGDPQWCARDDQDYRLN